MSLRTRLAAAAAAFRAAVQDPGGGRIVNSRDLARVLAAGQGTASGASVSEESALTVAAVFACVRIISQAAAMLPLNIKIREGEDLESERVDRTHPLHRVLSQRPNSWQTPFEFQQMMLCHLLLWGNFYGFVSRYGGVVQEIIPLDPRDVRAEQEDDLSISYQRYHKGELQRFAQREIMHIRGITLNGVLGESMIQLAREDIGLAMAQTRYAARFFGNAARPSGLLKTSKPLSPEATVRLRESFSDVFNGLNNSHKTVVLEEGMDWVKMGFDAEESQLLQSRKLSRSEIAMYFGVPPHMLGDVDKTTSWGSGIAQQSLGFLIYVIKPWLVNITQCVHRDLIAEAEQDRFFASFDTSELTAGDPEIEAKVASTYLDKGVLSVNEVRASLHYNPIPDGDAYVAPSGRQPAPPKQAPNAPAPANRHRSLVALPASIADSWPPARPDRAPRAGG